MKRDMSRKILGGVCAGIAKDLNINPWIIRILFIIFAHAIIGILVYLGLWVAMPADNTANS